MSVLQFGLKSFFRPRIYEIIRDDAPADAIECSRMWERATITIGGANYAATREGRMSGAFYLERNSIRIARAEKLSASRRRFTIEVGARTLILQAASAFGRSFILTEHDVQIGGIAPLNWWARRWRAEFPVDLSLEVQAFLIWLVIILWRRAQVAVVTTSTINTTLASS
jgi:hypothetical protein